MNHGRKRARHAWRFSVTRLLSLAVILLLGGFILSSKVMAQPRNKPANNTPAASASSVAAAASVSAAAPAPAAAEDNGVPHHTEGPYKSPFAHPTGGGPCNVKVGFLLNHVRNFDIKEGTYDAEFYLSYTSDKPMPEMDPDFTNGKIDDKEVVADTPTFKLYHFRGEFSAMPDLRDYPFDKQDLEIEIEENRNGTDQVVLIPDKEHTNLDAHFNMPGWLVEDFEARVLNHHYPDRFENDDLYYGRYHFILGVSRFATSAVFSVFVPAFVIVLISLTGLWLPRPELEVRSNASSPMLAAAVIFHFTLNQALPATPYLTRADKLMMGVYVSLLLNIMATWAWFIFDEKHEQLIFKLGKYIIPPVTIVVMIVASSV